MLTLMEKEEALLETVAMPTAEDWQPFFGDKLTNEIVERANEILVRALEWTKARSKRRGVTWGEIGKQIFTPLEELENEFQAGLLDSEGYQTVARFFAINMDPTMYNYLRYYGSRSEY